MKDLVSFASFVRLDLDFYVISDLVVSVAICCCLHHHFQ